MISRRVSLFVLVLASLAGSCASGSGFPSFRDVAPTDRFALSETDGAEEVSALAARFYAPEMDPSAMKPEVERLLAQHPSDATLHEMAAELAELREDDAAAWAHWMRAAADRRTPFTSIYLDRAFTHDLTTAETSASIALLEAIAREHPRPSARADAARRLVVLYESRERFHDAEALTADLGFIDQWKLIGAFDNDQGRGLLAEAPPEHEIDFDADVRGLLMPVRWRDATQMDRSGMVRLGNQVSPDRWAVAYLLTHVESDRPRDAELRVSAGDGLRVWLNGQIVIDQERIARLATDNIVVPIHLEQGWNRLLVKSAQDDEGAWVLGARITDVDGQPLAGLHYERALHEVPAVEAHEMPPNESPLAADLEAVEPPLRRLLLTHDDAVRNGFEGDALAHARGLLEAAPHHPVVLYRTVLTHWTNEELGQAMDTPERGGRALPGDGRLPLAARRVLP